MAKILDSWEWPPAYESWAPRLDDMSATLVLVEKGDLDTQTAADQLRRLDELERAALAELEKWAALYEAEGAFDKLSEQEERLYEAWIRLKIRRVK